MIETLTEAGNSYSVLTKGTLITRDLECWPTPRRVGVCTGAALSIPTLDEDVWRGTEPGAPNPARRADRYARLYRRAYAPEAERERITRGSPAQPVVTGPSSGRARGGTADGVRPDGRRSS